MKGHTLALSIGQGHAGVALGQQADHDVVAQLSSQHDRCPPSLVLDVGVRPLGQQELHHVGVVGHGGQVHGAAALRRLGHVDEVGHAQARHLFDLRGVALTHTLQKLVHLQHLEPAARHGGLHRPEPLRNHPSHWKQGSRGRAHRGPK